MLVNAVKDDLKLRLCGDNINFWIKVRDERKGHHSHMEHYFGNIAIIHNLNLQHLSLTKPQKEPEHITAAELNPTTEDIEGILDEYVYLTMKITIKYFACFKFFESHIPINLPDENTHQIASKTRVIPLPALHKNECHYGDVVDIMRYHTELMQHIYMKAGVEKNALYPDRGRSADPCHAVGE